MPERHLRNWADGYVNSAPTIIQQQRPHDGFTGNNNYRYQRRPNERSSHRMASFGGSSMNGNYIPNGNYARRFNADAPPFQPGVRYMPSVPQPTHNPYSAYNTYIQPLEAQSSFFGVQPRQSNPPVHSQYQALQQIYSAPQAYAPQLIQQQPQQPKYQQTQHAVPAYMTPQDQPFDNGDAGTGQQFAFSSELSNALQKSHNRYAVTEIQIGLEQLVSEPLEYELWSPAIKARISKPDEPLDKEDTDLIAWMIVEMASMGPNLQYAFSRLCLLIDSDVKEFTPNFVLPRIVKFIVNDASSLDAEHLSYFILFLAELYDSVQVNGTRVFRLGQYLMEQIRRLMSMEPLTDLSVKSVVQSLKLTGRHIEDDQDPAFLNAVFEELSNIEATSRSIGESVKHAIRQLVKLRTSQWGMTKTEEYLLNGAASTGMGEGIMYGPDGNPLSEEEQAFLEESCRDAETYGFNDEELADYDTFCQATAVSAAEKALERVSVDDDDRWFP